MLPALRADRRPLRGLLASLVTVALASTSLQQQWQLGEVG